MSINQRIVRSVRRDGYTLIELMAAMAVLSIGVLSVLHLQVLTIRGATFAREQAQAMEIMNTIIDDLQFRALAWIDAPVPADDSNPNTFLDSDFNTAFTQLTLTNQPAVGADLVLAGIQALQSVYGPTAAVGAKSIATGSAPGAAGLINVFMDTRGSGTNGIDGAGSVYRVHYLVYPVTPSGALVRMILFVSWDNKDFGRQDYNWTNWWNGGNSFWSRHVVSTSFYLARN